jgi:ABC-type antimicrobial peptide transport system permease subunit
VVGAWATARALTSALEGLPQAPTASLIVATLVMAAVCTVACLVPARRAMRISPAEAVAAD